MNEIDRKTKAPAGHPREAAAREWRRAYEAQLGDRDRQIRNRSGIRVEPLYWPEPGTDPDYDEKLGFPGFDPMTRGIQSSMYRGRTWTQRQLIGLGRPEDYNARVKAMIAAGATGLSVIPCNSVFRGYDTDKVAPELLGTCGTVLNTPEDMEIALDGIPLGEISVALNDPSPFTMLAQMLVLAERRGVDFATITGTANQSDYISHFVANHMFYRLSLTGARRVLLDMIEYSTAHLPRWNPLSIVGQHMQQAGATPAQAMGFTLSSAIQYAEDCAGRGMDLNRVLERFTFFFDISISFFEEVAKFRAGRRIWNRLVAERFGVANPRARRFKYHAQTSGVDLTRQQPLNNIARVAVQAMAGIFGGLQSLHTDSYDEVWATPTEAAARIAVATQNILKHEAHLCDVIDPLGGSYYVEELTDRMEEEILAVISDIDAHGGMFKAVETGHVQRLIGESALAFQQKLDSGDEVIVGVNAFTEAEDDGTRPPVERPDPAQMQAQIERLAAWKAARDNAAVKAALADLRAACNDEDRNVFEAELAATRAGATQGEIIEVMREELGFGQPLVVA